MDAPELRRVTNDEWAEFCRAWSVAFHEEPNDEAAESWRGAMLPDRCWTATDEVGHVASSGVMPFGISVPGGDMLGCAGITIVSVRTDHRRRGMLRRMMRRLHDDARAHDEPVAALYATEAGIYGRFGFGVGVPMHDLRVRSVDLRTLVGGDAGNVSLVAQKTWEDLGPRVTRAVGRQRPGLLDMSPQVWQARSWDPRSKVPFRFAAVGDRGILRYRVEEAAWKHGVPDAKLEVHDLIATDPQAELDLWAHVAAVDLVDQVVAPLRPVDEPLGWRVRDRGRVHTRSTGPLFVRMLDVPAALAARSWEVRDRLVVEVVDGFEPDNAGTWSLDVGPDGCEVVATDDPADVTMDVADLASLWLGGVSVATLADADRLDLATPAVAGRLRRMFAVDRAPWTPVDF